MEYRAVLCHAAFEAVLQNCILSLGEMLMIFTTEPDTLNKALTFVE